MADRETDAVAPLEALREVVELGGRDVGDRTAHLTHGGDRPLTHPAVRGRAVTEVDVFDHTDLFEVRQRPVDRCRVDVGVPFGKLLGRHATAVGVQVLQQFEPGPRDPAAALTHPLHRVVERDERDRCGAWGTHSCRVDAAGPPVGASGEVVHHPVARRLEQQP
jgi:hypothetical protein